jgi:hypothetical protein
MNAMLSETALRPLMAAAEEARVFGQVKIESRPQGPRLVCHALASGAPADYRLEADGERLFVLLATPDRWLSQSIEQDLVHTGDKLHDLIEEEAINLGLTDQKFPFEHFRDDDKHFIFRSRLPIAPGALSTPEGRRVALLSLLSYEAAFRPLGDMEVDGEE